LKDEKKPDRVGEFPLRCEEFRNRPARSSVTVMIVNLQNNINRLQKILFALAVLSIPLVSPAAPIRLDEQSDEKSAATARIGIENFGKVNDHFYRGSLPKQSDYAGLVALGVKTVISLRHQPDEPVRQSIERAGVRYINLPMNVRGYPPEDLAPRFLDLVNNPENWPVYVYCHGGRHRTGVMTAIYRMAIEGWDVQRAYAEMRRYGFYKRWGHGSMKTYVFDYYRQLQLEAAQSKRRLAHRMIFNHSQLIIACQIL
jgi:protein tyrosine/serine phosphatase